MCTPFAWISVLGNVSAPSKRTVSLSPRFFSVSSRRFFRSSKCYLYRFVASTVRT